MYSRGDGKDRLRILSNLGGGGGGAWMWPIVHLSMSVIIRGQTLWTSEDHVTMSLQGLLVPRGTDWNPSFKYLLQQTGRYEEF